MQTDVIHLMPFFFFFLGEKRAGGGKKQRDLEICFFLFVCLSLARLRLLFSLVPRIYLFFSSTVFLSFWLGKNNRKKSSDEGREEKGVRERERTKERKKV